MIKLTDTEKKLIKFCKLHYIDKYDMSGSWTESFKPLFMEIYGWSPYDYPYGYLNTLFDKLLDIQFKISDDKSGYNNQMREIFRASFYKSFSRVDDLPIERAISQLCGLIQSNTVRHRYSL